VTLETETGFGTGLRSSIERKQAVTEAPETMPLAREVAAVAASIEDAWAADAAAFGPLDIDPVALDTNPAELESLKAELQAALAEVEALRERERDLRAETAEQTRTQAQLQSNL
jgi:hypothetical protein